MKKILLIAGFLFLGLCSRAQTRQTTPAVSRQTLIEGVETLLEKDVLSGSTKRDSLWKDVCRRYPKESMPDTLLLDWTLKMGRLLVDRGLHTEIAPVFVRALEYMASYPSPAVVSYEVSIKTGLGAMYEEMGLWTKALNLFFSLLDQVPNPCSPQQCGDLNNNIGNIYFKQGYYDKAYLYYDTAIAIYTSIGSSNRLINVYNNMAALYYMQHDYNRTTAYLNRALALSNPEKDPKSYYTVLLNMASAYKQQKRYDIARAFVKEVLVYQQQASINLNMVDSYLLLATLYTQKDSVRYYLEMAAQKAEETQNPSARVEVMRAFYNFYTKQKQYKKANEVLERLMVQQDSLVKLDNRMRIESIEAINAIENDRQHKEFELQKAQMEKQRKHKREIWLIVMFILMIAVVFFVVYGYRTQRKLRKTNEEVARKNEQLHQMEKLQAEQKEREYQEALELKNKELTSKVLHLVKNNEYIRDITKELQKLLLELNPKMTATKAHISEILTKLRSQGNEGTYAEFQYYFEQVYQSFYTNLLQAYPNLTYKDLRLCAFLKLGLSSKEISAITFSEVRSVESARNRLRKKMGLEPDVNLIEFFARF